MSSSEFEFNAVSKEELVHNQKHHLLESIRFRLEAFDIPYDISDKLLDILLVYGEGFHRRLFDILKDCDQQQTAKRSQIVNELLTRRGRTPVLVEGVTHKDVSCKLALAIWTLFLKIIQHCLLSYSATGAVRRQDQLPELELEGIIDDFLAKSRQFEKESIDSKHALSAETTRHKDSLKQIAQDIAECKSAQHSAKREISALQEVVHDKAIAAVAIKDKIAATAATKAKREKEARYLQKQAATIRIRADQLHKKKMELKEQNDRLQSAIDHLRNKIDFYAQECEGYKAQYAHLAAIMGEHEAKMKLKRDAFDELKAAHWLLQRDNGTLERERIKKEASTVQFQSQKEVLLEKLSLDSSKIEALDQDLATHSAKMQSEEATLKARRAGMAAAVAQKDAELSMLRKMRLELDAKCAVLEAAQQEFTQQQARISEVEVEIEALEAEEERLVNEVDSRRADVDAQHEEAAHVAAVYKTKLAELNDIENLMVGHAKQVNLIEAELKTLQSQIADMDAKARALQQDHARQAEYIAKETATRAEQTAAQRGKVDKTVSDLAEHAKATRAVDDELYLNEKLYTDALLVLSLETAHLAQLKASKAEYAEQYRALLYKHRQIEQGIAMAEREMVELDHKMQQQLIDTNDWKSRIYAVSQVFDAQIKARCQQIEALRARQSKVASAIIEKDRSLVSIRREQQNEVDSVQQRNQKKVIALETDLSELCRRPFEVKATESQTAAEVSNDKMALENQEVRIKQLKRMIVAATAQHSEYVDKVSEVKDRNTDLVNDWDTTRLCKEHLKGELNELNEYQSQLQRKLSSLQQELTQQTRVPVDRQSVAVGTETCGDEEEETNVIN